MNLDKMCGRCYEEVDKLYPPNCQEKPEQLLGQPLGMYHCPDCGAMVIAGVPHPELCKRCLDRQHPAFDVVSAPDVTQLLTDEEIDTYRFDCISQAEKRWKIKWADVCGDQKTEQFLIEISSDTGKSVAQDQSALTLRLVKEAGWKSPKEGHKHNQWLSEMADKLKVAHNLDVAEAVKQTKAEVEKIVDSNYTDRVKLWEALKAYCGALPRPDDKE